MDLNKLAQALGPIPVMFGGISDGCQLFNKSEAKKLAKTIRTYQALFPQSRLHVVSRTFDQKADIPVILFWVFNRAGLSEESSKQGKNRDVVILIEPKRKQAAMMVGYGLEPILPQEALDQIIERTEPHLSSEDYLTAMEIAIDSLIELMKSVSTELPHSVGLQTALATDFGANDF
ncbi:TPM domain-containing protein [Akkermansiaceae bacterium]|nr:TPM domain-containing protein [Akkermansiaceae bacterium]